MKSLIIFLMGLLTQAYLIAQTQLTFSPELTVYGLRTIPTGKFASTSDDNSGFAKSGFGAGVDFALVTQKNVAVVATLNYSTNPIDGEGLKAYNNLPSNVNVQIESYTSMFLMGGARVDIPVAESVQPFGMVQVGLLLGSYPGYKVEDQFIRLSASSASSSSLAFGATVGVKVLGSIHASFRYLTAKPNYQSEISYTLFNGKIVATGEIPTSMVMVVLGYTF